MTTLLSVDELVIEFETHKGRRRVVDGVSFSLKEGEVLGILGESGSGKTVSTLSIMGLVNGEPGIVSGRADINVSGSRIGLLDNLADYVELTGGSYRKRSRAWNRLVRRRMKAVWGTVITPVFKAKGLHESFADHWGPAVESVRLANRGFLVVRFAKKARWLKRVRMPDPDRVYVISTSFGECAKGDDRCCRQESRGFSSLMNRLRVWTLRFVQRLSAFFGSCSGRKSSQCCTSRTMFERFCTFRIM